MADEYFIRGPEEETANGPYSVDSLQTLAEAGKVTPEHYYFDPRMESWAPIRTNEELFQQVFPEKKKLTLRKKEPDEIESINPEEESGSVKVEDMLAEAEGNTEETRHIRTKRVWEERTASLAVPVIGIMLLASALSVLYPSWNIIEGILNENEGAWRILFQEPVVFLGALDLLMGAFLLLNATEIFPLIRFRAMFGAGFFAVVHAAAFLNGNPDGLWLAISFMAFGIGLYTCTLTLNFNAMVVSAVAGIGGVAGIIWFINIAPLLIGS